MAAAITARPSPEPQAPSYNEGERQEWKAGKCNDIVHLRAVWQMTIAVHTVVAQALLEQCRKILEWCF